MTTSTDRIEKQVLLRAPRARVWRAITDVREFGTWFQAKLEGDFREGATVRGRVTSAGYEHVPLEIMIERIEPERLLAYRWRPYAIDPSVDYSNEPTTLVEFRLEDAPGGTRVTIVESGFDRVPIARRAEAYRAHDGGWVEQAENLRKYVGG